MSQATPPPPSEPSAQPGASTSEQQPVDEPQGTSGVSSEEHALPGEAVEGELAAWEEGVDEEELGEGVPVFASSVRDVVSFVLMEGSLERGGLFTARSNDAAIEGTRGHQEIQSTRPENYEAEVSLKTIVLSRGEPDFALKLRGRVDGVWMHEEGRIQIEEIKTVSGARPIEPKGQHWAQAKLYAWMYLLEHPLESIEIGLTYMNRKTRAVKTFVERFSREETFAFAQELIGTYISWMRHQMMWEQQRDASIATLDFPYPAYRPGQRQMAVATYRTIAGKKQGMLEAPTGVGKTMAVLFPAVKSLREGHARKLFFLTAKTPGRRVAEKALLDMRARGLALRSLTMTARDKICFKPEDAESCDVEECPFAIGYYDRLRDALTEAQSMQHFDRPTIEALAQRHQLCPFELSLDLAVWMDVIICDYNYAFDPGAQLRRFFEDGGAYVLLVDEAHNLPDRARKMFSAQIDKAPLLQLKRDLQKQAPETAKLLHRINVAFVALQRLLWATGEDQSRRHELEKKAGYQDQQEVTAAEEQAARQAAQEAGIAAFNVSQEGEGSDVCEAAHGDGSFDEVEGEEGASDEALDTSGDLGAEDAAEEEGVASADQEEGEAPKGQRKRKKRRRRPLTYERFVDSRGGQSLILSKLSREWREFLWEFLAHAEYLLQAHPEAAYAEALQEQAFLVRDFLRALGWRDKRFRLIFSATRRDAQLWLYCVDPSGSLQRVIRRCQAAMFFSATLSPRDYFQSLIGCPEEETTLLQLDSPFPPEHFEVFVDQTIETTYRKRGQTYGDVAQAILAMVSRRQGNYLVFFPSYRYLEEVLVHVLERGSVAKLLVQEPGMTEEEREAFLRAFEASSAEGCLGFAVMGGIFGEGVDLVGDRLIGAIVVGVGLPQIGLERDLIRAYFEALCGEGFAYAYVFPGIGRVLQAAGRVIRSETDRGSLLLIDRRYQQQRYQVLLPRWWQIQRFPQPGS